MSGPVTVKGSGSLSWAYGSVLGRLPVAPACAVRKRERHRVRPQGDQPRRLTAGRRLSGKTGLQGRDV